MLKNRHEKHQTSCRCGPPQQRCTHRPSECRIKGDAQEYERRTDVCIQVLEPGVVVVVVLLLAPRPHRCAYIYSAARGSSELFHPIYKAESRSCNSPSSLSAPLRSRNFTLLDSPLFASFAAITSPAVSGGVASSATPLSLCAAWNFSEILFFLSRELLPPPSSGVAAVGCRVPTCCSSNYYRRVHTRARAQASERGNELQRW